MSDLLKDLKLFTPCNQLFICTLVIIFPFNAFPFLAYIMRKSSLIQGIIKKPNIIIKHANSK